MGITKSTTPTSMSKQRKFNARALFDGFLGHEGELKALFSTFGHTPPDPFTTEAACRVTSEDFGSADPLTAIFHQFHDLATPKGREIIEAVAASFAIGGDIPGGDVTHQRAALWLWNADKDAFDSAMDRLAVAGVHGGQIAMFPGQSAKPIEDTGAAVAAFEAKLNDNLKDWNGAESFKVHHYLDGTMLVILVFCERTAETRMEMDHTTKAVKTRIGRPVVQDVLFYDQSTGELEIEAGRPKHREILRNAFAVGVMGDDGFFTPEEHSRVLNLMKLRERGFDLPTKQGHSASITAITLKIPVGGKQLSANFGANRHDVVAAMRSLDSQRLLASAIIRKVRIELVVGSGRLDRKSIELSAPNGIKFNRASHVDTVYQYLRHWSLMGQGDVADQSAA
jgi:hypothetical protein